MPSLTRKPKADPAVMYVVTEGFAGDRELGYWAPRIGTRLPGSDPRIQWLFEHDAADLFLAPDGLAAGRSSSADDARRQVAAMERAQARESREVADPSIRTSHEIPRERQVRALRDLLTGGTATGGPAGSGVAVFAGQILDRDSAVVKANPDAFAPVE